MLLLNGQAAGERKDRVLELLKAVDLLDRVNNRPNQLSGGQQQRVAIARALAPMPSLILADEPTANLDTENGRQVMDIMKKSNKDTGVNFHLCHSRFARHQLCRACGHTGRWFESWPL